MGVGESPVTMLQPSKLGVPQGNTYVISLSTHSETTNAPESYRPSLSYLIAQIPSLLTYPTLALPLWPWNSMDKGCASCPLCGLPPLVSRQGLGLIHGLPAPPALGPVLRGHSPCALFWKPLPDCICLWPASWGPEWSLPGEKGPPLAGCPSTVLALSLWESQLHGLLAALEHAPFAPGKPSSLIWCQESQTWETDRSTPGLGGDS